MKNILGFAIGATCATVLMCGVALTYAQSVENPPTETPILLSPIALQAKLLTASSTLDEITATQIIYDQRENKNVTDRLDAIIQLLAQIKNKK